MTKSFPARIGSPLATLLILLSVVSPVWATCGGGGGGGVGGVSGGSGGPTPTVYNVPWKVRAPQDPPPQGLIVYWFPASENELKNSSLRASRSLSLYASQCISMEVADVRIANADKLVGTSKLPVAVLATPDGTPVSKLENKDGKLKVDLLEKAVETEVKQRETAINERMKEAKAKVAAGDTATAITLYQSVLEQKCMFPKKAKESAKELKKLGVNEVAALAEAPDFGAPVFESRQSAVIDQTLRRGLIAEINERYLLAEKLYSKAHLLDRADPTPLRYLGELYRHHIGDWDKARSTFETILAIPCRSALPRGCAAWPGQDDNS